MATTSYLYARIGYATLGIFAIPYTAAVITNRECERTKRTLYNAMERVEYPDGDRADGMWWGQWLTSTKQQSREYRRSFARVAYRQNHPLRFVWSKITGIPMTEFEYSVYKDLKSKINQRTFN